MSIFDEIKAKADANGDGKLSQEDLNSLKDKLPTDQFNKLQELADRNDDGKINLDDIQNFDFGDFIKDAQNALGDVFGKQ